jgi:hypothetical protein
MVGNVTQRKDFVLVPFAIPATAQEFASPRTS